MEIAPIKAKADRKKEPNKEKYAELMRKFDQEADEIRKTIRAKNDEKKKIREGGNVKGTNVTYKDFMQK